MNERRFRAIDVSDLLTSSVLTEGRIMSCIQGLPKDAAYMYSYMEHGNVFAVFYHPSFGPVPPDAIIPLARIEYFDAEGAIDAFLADIRGKR